MLLQISPFGSLNIDRERNKIFICMHSEYWVFIIPSQICTSRKTLLIDWIPFLSYHLLLQIRDIWIQISFSRGWFVWEQKSNAWVMTRRRQQAFAVWSRAAPQPASLAIFWQLSAVTLSEWNTSSDGLSGEGLHRLRTSPCVFLDYFPPTSEGLCTVWGCWGCFCPTVFTQFKNSETPWQLRVAL